jgi:hypothetical protein
MNRRPFRYILRLERLEDRNAPSDSLQSLLAELNEPLASPLAHETADVLPPPRANFMAGR